MKAKQVYLKEEEQVILQTLVAMEIQHNKDYEDTGVEPAFKTEMLKHIYKKLTGYEWKEN